MGASKKYILELVTLCGTVGGGVRVEGTDGSVEGKRDGSGRQDGDCRPGDVEGGAVRIEKGEGLLDVAAAAADPAAEVTNSAVQVLLLVGGRCGRHADGTVQDSVGDQALFRVEILVVVGPDNRVTVGGFFEILPQFRNAGNT